MINNSKQPGTHRYVYGAPFIGRADASSSIIGLQRNRMKVAMVNDIGELIRQLSVTIWDYDRRG